MKPDSITLALLAAALLAAPAYSGAQQVSPAAPDGGGKAPVAAAAVAPASRAAVTTPATAKAAAAGSAEKTSAVDVAETGQVPAATREAAKAAAADAGQTAAPAVGQAAAGAAEVSTAPAPVVAPEAAAALKRSSDFLQALKSFNVRVDSSTDEVLDGGQKLQRGSVADISVIRPDRLRVDLVADDRQRQFYYDGRTLSLYAKRENYYASVKVPGTIKEMLAFTEKKYGLEWPLVDLLNPESLAQNVRSGFVVGEGRVGGVLCDHYAFRQDDVDWQIWIQKGKTPLPRKIVITTKDEEGAPQHATVLSWNLSAKFPDSAFQFVAPKRAQKIVFRELDSDSGNKN